MSKSVGANCVRSLYKPVAFARCIHPLCSPAVYTHCVRRLYPCVMFLRQPMGLVCRCLPAGGYRPPLHYISAAKQKFLACRINPCGKFCKKCVRPRSRIKMCIEIQKVVQYKNDKIFSAVFSGFFPKNAPKRKSDKIQNLEKSKTQISRTPRQGCMKYVGARIARPWVLRMAIQNSKKRCF